MELTEAELQEKIDSAVAGASEGVLNKNKELLNELKQAKKLNTGFDGIDIEALQADSASLAIIKQTQQEKSGEFEKLYNQHKVESEKILSNKDAEIANLNSTLSGERKGTALTKELVKGIAVPELIGTAVDILAPQVSMNAEGEAMVGDVPLNTFVESWKTSDVGKHFFSDGNSGGTGTGSTGGGETEADFFNKDSPRFSMTKQAEVAKRSPDSFVKYKNLFTK